MQLITRGAAEGKEELEDQSAVISDERAQKILEERRRLEEQMQQIDDSQTNINLDLFDDLPVQSSPSGINPALSPTLLPSEEDREIAMRMQQPGIAGLVV